MKSIYIYRFTLVTALIVLAPWSTPAAPKPILVHYLPWFVAKPYSGNWGWHWTMNHFSPDVTSGAGEREIASWYYPLIGPYDSADPVLLEYHVLLMKLGGIDGVIVDWYGMDNYLDYGLNNQRTATLFEYTRKAGLRFSLCYEDRTIQQEINGGFITAANALSHAQQTLLYLQTNYFGDPGYLRWSNQPVLLNFGPQYFQSNSQWQTIFAGLNPTNRPAFFTLDQRLPVGAGAFNWPPMWLSQTNAGILARPALESYLANFQQAGSSWPAFISCAVPRFHDIYAQAGVGPSYGMLNDSDGDTFRATLGRALTNNSALIQIVTWNDFGEGTMVEPTKQYGYRDVGIIQDFRRQFLETNFPHHTNDLTLATRLYASRRQYAGNTPISAELDRVFTNVVSGRLGDANLQLTGIETGRPVIYDLSLAGGQLQFVVGGYLASGVQVQMASNVNGALWQTVRAFSVTTNQIRFTADLPPQSTSSYFRVQ